MPTQLSIMDEVLGHRTHRWNKQIRTQTCITRYILWYIVWVNSSNWICWFVGSLVRCFDWWHWWRRTRTRTDANNGNDNDDGEVVDVDVDVDAASPTSPPIDTCHIRNATSKSFVTRRLRRTVSMSEQWTNRWANKTRSSTHPSPYRLYVCMPHAERSIPRQGIACNPSSRV